MDNFGRHLADGLVALLAVIVVASALVGIGLYEGCGYVYRHVDVSWDAEQEAGR